MPNHVIGLMSGTSLDGCDAALVDFAGEKPHLVAFLTLPMPVDLRDEVLSACDPARSAVDRLCSLNVWLGRYFAQAALAVADKAGIPMSEVRLIASHGQTLWHIPRAEEGLLPSTLQIGDAATIAALTGRPVASGFREMDMALGGQGAPMVCLADLLLYGGDKARCLQNIGGIGNVSYLPRGGGAADILAFDTGPGNMVIDAFCRVLFDRPFDANGDIAAKGQVNQALLSNWLALPYFALTPPKTTGRELFGQAFAMAELAAHKDMSPHDLVATATAFTAASIADQYRRFVLPRGPIDEIVLSGGGAHNLTIRRMLAELLPGIPLLTQEDLGFDADSKEAVAFALLGWETLHHRPGNVPAATGARSPAILGHITWGTAGPE